MTRPVEFDLSPGPLADTTRKEALKALQKDGAIILTNLLPGKDQSWQELAEDVPNRLFQESELAVKKHTAAAVHVEHEQLNLEGDALPPHTDGYIWGDKYPDIILLICEEASSCGGGANFLLDGQEFVEEMTLEHPQWLEKLKTVPVDHTERSHNGVANGVESVVPVWRWQDAASHIITDGTSSWWDSTLSSDRLAWRRMVPPVANQIPKSLWEPIGQAELMAQALNKLDDCIAIKAETAPRFSLKTGQALVVDNFRLLHARDSFTRQSSNRRMWRVWVWSSLCMGVPDEIRDAEGSAGPATPIDAGKALACEGGDK